MIAVFIPSMAGAESFRLPEFLHVQQKGLASSWDGRLVFDAKYLGEVAGEKKYGWSVRAFRTEKVGSSGDPFADLQNVPDLFSAAEVFDWDVGSPNYGTSPSQADGRLHMAVYPSPGYPENPYRSDAAGNPSTTGAFETYQIRIIGKYKNVLASTVPPADQEKLLGRHAVRVVVENPRTVNAAIRDATVLSEARLLKTGSTVLHGYEPTISMDGRLLIWQGHPNNDLQIRFVMYSYNPNPHAVDGQPASVEDTGWSYPKTVSAMYAQHGPGAPAETVLPDGTLFSDQYPIARRPLSVYAEQGGVSQILALDEATPMPGAYPWLSWDASELFFPIVPNYKATLRSAFAVIGARTEWILEHVDGPVNWTRGNVTDTITNWHGLTTTGDALRAAYGALTAQLHPSSLKHPLDYETILLAPLGLGHSMWSADRGNPEIPVPYFGGSDTYSLVASHSGRYFEVPLFRVRDGRFLASFPFNEALKLDVATTQQLVATTGGSLYWELARDAVTYQESTTLDVSGSGLVGTLENGAAFPYDYKDAETQWQNSQVLVDYTEGVKGNSIYFPAGAYVETSLGGDLVGAMGGGWSVSLWLQPLDDLTSSQFPFLILGNYLVYMGNWGSTIKIGIRDETTSALLADINMAPAADVLTPAAGWRHLALSYQGGELSMYLNGSLVGKASLTAETAAYLESALRDGQARNLSIGPRGLTGSGSDAVMRIDEFDLLSAPLDERTLSRLAFSGPLAEPPPNPSIEELGRQLFFDTRLSANQRVSCATCHRPEAAHGDTTATSAGVYARQGSRNTPALLGSTPSHSKMLTASVPSAAAQWLLPLSHELEMATSLDVVLDRLSLDADLVQEMQTLFGSGPSAETIGAALEAYVDGLAPEADLDHPSIVNHPGRELFLGRARCVNCHSGSRLSDGHLHAVRSTTDPGRALDTGLARDMGKFKTAALLGAADSAPYFHDGSVADLTQVVQDYNDGFVDNPNRSPDLRPLHLSTTEIADLADFLAQIPATASAPPTDTLGNHVSNYGVGCAASDCFWMVVEGSLPAGVEVEVRDASSGAVVQTITPNVTPGSGSTSMTGRLTGSVLTAYQQTGVLLNIRYVNESGRVVRSGPRFLRSDPAWPGAQAAPSITGSGVGCVDLDCIWITATNLDDHTVVEVSNAETGEVVALYSGALHKVWGYKGANVTPSTGVVTLQVDPEHWPAFADGGLRVRLVNRHFSNNPNLDSAGVVVTSPNVGS